MAGNLWKLTIMDPPLVHADGRKKTKALFPVDEVSKES
jgi:hypothetical protein